MLPLLATPTFAGLRAAQIDLGIEPTSAPHPHEILKRLSGDPAICGWIEGNSRPSCDAKCSLNRAALICDGQTPYCATYQYAQGSQGFGCAPVTGYNKTVLTTTDAAITPFGQASSTTPSSSETNAQPATVTAGAPSTSSSPVDMKLISGGAIAGAVAGSVLALAAIVGIVVFFWRRHRTKKERERVAATRMAERSSSQYMYAQYAKPAPSTLSPPTSPPMHSRHPSDQTYGFPSSPPLSDDRPWSPETVVLPPGPAELGVGDEAIPGKSVESSNYSMVRVDREWTRDGWGLS
ncbi:MAG: hypothetical protein L6R40_006033 [Gallowayella cf. fulva]|nr:MAG: hypothetical protein L6R40_006033 [Xanthomendoza cf. fulva]